jgi:hypothetical protein
MIVELLYFEGCPNHVTAESLVKDVLSELGLTVPIWRIEVPDEAIGLAVRFPGSPTIRVNGIDIEPGFAGCEDCTPRCRVYPVDGRLGGLPAREWLLDAFRRAMVDEN